jgi:hypothetical protein
LKAFFLVSLFCGDALAFVGMRLFLWGCARFCGDALAARAFISFARPKETNQRKAAGSISEAKNRMIFPKTGKRSPLRSVWTSPFLHGKITRFSLRLSEEAGIGFSGWDGCSVVYAYLCFEFTFYPLFEGVSTTGWKFGLDINPKVELFIFCSTACREDPLGLPSAAWVQSRKSSNWINRRYETLRMKSPADEKPCG